MQPETIDQGTCVQQTPKGRSVFATRDFQEGETVVVGRRIRILLERSIYSLQMDFELHVELDQPACLINHSCQPNTGVRNNPFGGYDFVALVDIATGEEITFDYETTEYISIAVPHCLCSMSNCRGKTRGFQFLDFPIRQRYGNFIADYLKSSHPF